MTERTAELIATLCFVGKMRPAPGTWGSLVTLPVAFVCATLSATAFFVLIGCAFGVGWWAIHALSKGSAPHDPPEIVVDEFAGQLVALIPVIWAAGAVDVGLWALWPGWVAAFVLFRVFDIWKPGPVGWADRREDALGVMLDDIIAGVFAGVGVVALAVLYHGFV